MHCFVSFLVFNHLYERDRERAVCSTLFAFLVSCDCYVALSHEAMGLSAVCDCGISWSYSLVFFCIYNIITIELYATFIKKKPLAMPRS